MENEAQPENKLQITTENKAENTAVFKAMCMKILGNSFKPKLTKNDFWVLEIIWNSGNEWHSVDTVRNWLNHIGIKISRRKVEDSIQLFKDFLESEPKVLWPEKKEMWLDAPNPDSRKMRHLELKPGETPPKMKKFPRGPHEKFYRATLSSKRQFTNLLKPYYAQQDQFSRMRKNSQNEIIRRSERFSNSLQQEALESAAESGKVPVVRISVSYKKGKSTTQNSTQKTA